MSESEEVVSLDEAGVREQLRAFANARDWDQFHSPKNLAMALAGESGELVEIFQWLTEDQSRNLQREDLVRARGELADIQIYLIRIADVLGISLAEAVSAKLLENEGKYPVELSKGNATKYSLRGDI